MSDRRQALAWEERWATPAALAAIGAVVLIVAAIAIAALGVGGSEGESELLRNVDAHRGAQMASSVLQAIGVGLLAVPLYYLFRAARVRSDRMRGQLVGIVVAAPLFLAALAILSGISTLQAASDFVSDEVPRLLANGVQLSSDRADEIANDTITEAPLRGLAAGFGIGGQLGFVVAMAYTCLNAMRVGLLPRFWGSLGVALGAVSFLFFQFALLWFIYFGVLLLRRDSQPPAWAAGEAIPWPAPGEKTATELSASAEENEQIPPIEDSEEPVEKGQSQ
jgi:hypothetical protein